MASPISFPTQSASLKSAADALLSKGKTKLDWKPVDVSSLPAEFAALFSAYREAQAVANAHREAFEDAICGPLAKMLDAKPGQDVAFTYRFGLAVALTDKAQPASKAIRF